MTADRHLGSENWVDKMDLKRVVCRVWSIGGVVVTIVERGHCNETREANETAANANSDDTVRTDIYESEKEGGTHPRAELERRCVYALPRAHPRIVSTIDSLA